MELEVLSTKQLAQQQVLSLLGAFVGDTKRAHKADLVFQLQRLHASLSGQDTVVGGASNGRTDKKAQPGVAPSKKRSRADSSSDNSGSDSDSDDSDGSNDSSEQAQATQTTQMTGPRYGMGSDSESLGDAAESKHKKAKKQQKQTKHSKQPLQRAPKRKAGNDSSSGSDSE
eukprot:m.491158 g.491158  ORF g.491158 m.491158 type:complete len:171 (+) comp29367_c0_seq1:179-691(+)